jgi:hypothetical protein
VQRFVIDEGPGAAPIEVAGYVALREGEIAEPETAVVDMPILAVTEIETEERKFAWNLTAAIVLFVRIS